MGVNRVDIICTHCGDKLKGDEEEVCGDCFDTQIDISKLVEAKIICNICGGEEFNLAIGHTLIVGKCVSCHWQVAWAEDKSKREQNAKS